MNTKEFLSEKLPEYISLEQIGMKESLKPDDDGDNDVTVAESSNGISQMIQPEEENDTKKSINPAYFYLGGCFVLFGIQAIIYIMYEKKNSEEFLKRKRAAKQEEEMSDWQKESQKTLVIECDPEAVFSISTMTDNNNQITTEQIWMDPTSKT